MFELVFEHNDFLVINKAPNVSVHKDDNETALLLEVGKITGDEQLYLIHRLDKMTSGLLLLGRNKKAASILSQLFAKKDIQKFYLGVSGKKPTKKQGAVIGDMAKSRRGMWKLLPTKENPAVTQFFSVSLGVGKRLFLCKPHTGKTHQIRVALKSIGASLLGDELYSGHKADRGYLHAFALQFSYRGELFSFQCLPTKGSYWGNIPDPWLTPDALVWPKIAKSRQG